jgi:hypothetical protein
MGDNAMKKPVTVVPFPWDAPKLVAASEPPAPLVASTFNGKVGKRDIRHMAMAILQMSDELHEMRERIRALEMAVAAKPRDMLK